MAGSLTGYRLTLNTTNQWQRRLAVAWRGGRWRGQRDAEGGQNSDKYSRTAPLPPCLLHLITPLRHNRLLGGRQAGRLMPHGAARSAPSASAGCSVTTSPQALAYPSNAIKVSLRRRRRINRRIAKKSSLST